MLDQSSLGQLKQLKRQIRDNTPRDKGIVKGTSKRFGFVIAETDKQQYLLPQNEMDRVLPGDRVQFVLEKGNKETNKGKDDKPIAKLEKLIESSFTHFIGQIKTKNNQMYVIPDDFGWSRWIFVPPKSRKGYEDGDLVSAEICQHPFNSKGRVQAKITGMIGKPDDPFIEHRYAICKQAIPEKIWQDDELAAVRQTSEQLLEETLEKREDLRDLTFFTIDGVSTQDLDDAIFIEKNEDGFFLHVAIADASTFVEEKSPLDKIASGICSSIYLPGQKVSMLPDVLSADICSLKEQQDRLAFVCKMAISASGEITSTEFIEAAIQSKAKLSYDAVSEVIENGSNSDINDEKIIEQLQLLKAVYDVRRSYRESQYLATDEYPDYRLNLDEKGKIASIERHERNIAQKFIEECMLSCNESAASFMSKHLEQALYLVHPGYKEDQLPGVNKLLNAEMEGFDTDSVTALDGYIKLQKSISETSSELPLKEILRKKLSRSEWQSQSAPHFGLGINAYTTFTSPIRKYSDLTVHRLIKSVLREKANKLINDKLLEQLNERNQAVRNAQRDCELSLKCQFLKQFVGKSFDGSISMINHRMVGVYLEEFDIHGQIEVKTLNQPFTFKQDSLQLISEDHHFMLGQNINITVHNIDEKQRQIRFLLTNENSNEESLATA